MIYIINHLFKNDKQNPSIFFLSTVMNSQRVSFDGKWVFLKVESCYKFVFVNLERKLQMISNYYETLELAPKASSQQIAENFKKLALRYHPKTSK